MWRSDLRSSTCEIDLLSYLLISENNAKKCHLTFERKQELLPFSLDTFKMLCTNLLLHANRMTKKS